MDTLPETLLSTIQNFKVYDGLPSNVTHPFATSAETSCGVLQDIIQASDQLANSLNQYLQADFTNTKLVSLLRQQATLSRSLHLSDLNIQQTLHAFKQRSKASYGEDIPQDRGALIDWCVARCEAWGRLVGMETFKDEVGEGSISFVFGGKVLVVDLELSIDRADPLDPKIRVSKAKTSYAISNPEATTMDGSLSLDAFLKDSFQCFFAEVQKPDEQRDPVEAAKLGSVILDHFRYLVMLDRLAERKEDGGVRWFVDVDQLCTVVETFAKSEAEAVALSMSTERSPLDIFLLRAHTLPLPYLKSPSLSFLTYLSPLAYLSLLRDSSALPTDPNMNLPNFDIPLHRLRSKLATSLKGATIATLTLSPPIESHIFPASMSIPTLTARPTFSLVPAGSDLEHVFPQLADLPASTLDPVNNESSGRNVWFLDFTEGGKYPGIVMSQSRMREIELVINPLSSMETMNTMGMMSFGTGSWVDLLINPSSLVSPERYVSIFRSPSSAHPPLQLRLTAPEEPGFVLHKIPVNSMKEVWGVLEVVREQCWLNEILSGCEWNPEGLQLSHEQNDEQDNVTEADLDAVLSGSVTPRKIPVNIFVPSHSGSPGPIFDNPGLNDIAPKVHRTKIVMTSPERPPISGLVEICVSFDETKPRGVNVELNGAMGSDLRPEVMEEICRRGGTLSLSGRIWAKAHGSLQ
ncbi:hypothetical protein DFH05DRAFT_1475820 [Lentinula detonsa]|uniref:Mediator complex subunit 1 n=1 Tax=Lentinula detonsa TaxID=2804962 RepID=A0A9W8U1Q0_9AGAR|nr:hypothetical protein DFH05DRAFT_1475820 [Lentinula detonsa]KAJ3984426.1 hypothetical protein F5890DRAFT_1517033 [Lentinula detonsa]